MKISFSGYKIPNIHLKPNVYTTNPLQSIKEDTFELSKSDGTKTLNTTDKDVKTKFKRIYTKSEDIAGAVNIQNVYPDGTVKDVVKYSRNKETGVLTVKKDLISPDGTRTECFYSDDPKGNRVSDYKITDSKGKVLYRNHQSFEKISENKFISANDSRKYEITTDEKSIKVKEVNLGKEATVIFAEKVEDENRGEIISLLKKVPGHLLFEAAEDIKEFRGLKSSSARYAYSEPFRKSVATADNLFIFLHELGHIKDAETLSLTDRKYQYSGNPKIQQVYMYEYKNFVKNFAPEQRKPAQYFLVSENHYHGKWGGLGEVVAETNAIGSSVSVGDVNSAKYNSRTEYLMENFPKTIAEIKNAMKLKDEIDAIEYYGT